MLHRSAILFTRSCLHRKCYLTFFQPSTTKRSQTSSTGQKRKSDEDPQEILGPKYHVFSSKWLEEFAWLVYVSTKNHFLNSNREKTLTEVCEMLAKPGAYEDILPSFVILAQVLLTIPITSVPCERGFSAQNRIHGAK